MSRPGVCQDEVAAGGIGRDAGEFDVERFFHWRFYCLIAYLLAKPAVATILKHFPGMFVKNVIIHSGRYFGHCSVGKQQGLTNMGVLSHFGPIVSAVGQCGNFPGERGGVARLDQDSLSAMTDRLDNAGDSRRNHRDAGRHRLEHDHRQPFAEKAGQHQQVHVPQFGRHVAGEAGPDDLFAQVEALDERFDFASYWVDSNVPTAPQAMTGNLLLAEQGHCAQQNLDHFSRPEQRRDAEGPAVGWNIARGRRFETRHAVRRHDDSPGVESLAGNMFGHRLRYGDNPRRTAQA